MAGEACCSLISKGLYRVFQKERFNFENLYTNLFRGHVQCFELS
jgi:hypothetical protein